MSFKFDFFVKILGLLAIQMIVENTFDLNFPILRYVLAMFGMYALIRTKKRPLFLIKRYTLLVRICFLTIIVMGCYSIFIGLPVIFSGLNNYLGLKAFLGGEGLLFIFPLLLFWKPSLSGIRSLLQVSYYLLFGFLVFFLLKLPEYLSRESSPENIIRILAGSTGFLVLMARYFESSKRYFVIGVFSICFLMMVYHARRNMVLYYGSSLFFTYFIYLFNGSKGFSRFALIFRSIIALVLFSLLVLVLNLDFSLFLERSATGFDSRDGVFEEFFEDIKPFSDDFYFGRGMNGGFFSDYLGYGEVGALASGNRGLIENGYLQIILNFGFLFLLSFVVLSLIGFYKGVFKSNNVLAKVAGCYLIINLIDMIGYGIPQLTMKYLFVWMSMAICFSPLMMALKDQDVRKELIF